MSEKCIKADIKLAFGSKPDITLFQNEQMQAWLQGPGGLLVPYQCGLGEGTGDLIGWRTVIIRPEHVGKPFARFLGAEIKKPGHRTKKARLVMQQAFVRSVVTAGGIGFFADSVESFAQGLELFK